MKVIRVIYTVEVEAAHYEDDEQLEDDVRFAVTDEDVQMQNVSDAVHEDNFMIVSTRIEEEVDI